MGTNELWRRHFMEKPEIKHASGLTKSSKCLKVRHQKARRLELLSNVAIFLAENY